VEGISQRESIYLTGIPFPVLKKVKKRIPSFVEIRTVHGIWFFMRFISVECTPPSGPVSSF
jgi:hypothetical protein